MKLIQFSISQLGTTIYENKSKLFGDLFGKDETARHFTPENIEFALNQIQDFAKKFE